jgi:hypothetical protein
MANTYTLIASSTVGSGGAATIDFTSIPQTYTDLLLSLSIRTNRAGAVGSYFYLSFNGNTSNFSSRFLGGDGSSASSGTQAQLGGIEANAGATASTFASNQIYIPNYTSSNFKSFSTEGVVENNATTGFDYLIAGLWSNTSAITSITITPENVGSYVQYSTAYLYGISNS